MRSASGSTLTLGSRGLQRQVRAGIGGPGEGPGVLIVLGEIAVDGRLQVDDRTEDAALEPPSGQGREESPQRC